MLVGSQSQATAAVWTENFCLIRVDHGQKAKGQRDVDIATAEEVQHDEAQHGSTSDCWIGSEVC